jgi:hypothetical protein
VGFVLSMLQSATVTNYLGLRVFFSKLLLPYDSADE